MQSEADYLNQQSARAMARFRRTASKLADEVLEPIDIRPFIQHHPWWSVASAAVGGFLSGFGLGRRKRETADGRAGSRSHRMIAMISNRVWRVLRTALGPVLVAELRGNSARGRGASESNGNGAARRPREASDVG